MVSTGRKSCVSSCHQGWLLEVDEALEMMHNLRKCFRSQVISCGFCHSWELNPFLFFFQMYIVTRCKVVDVMRGETLLSGLRYPECIQFSITQHKQGKSKHLE